MQKIGIIGGGFCGTMTAVHLIRYATDPIEIIIINQKETFNKGVAFKPASNTHLLNVPTIKMSAFANEPTHFLDWIMQQLSFKHHNREFIANAFLPRYLYGQYLSEIWQQHTLVAISKNIVLTVIDGLVTQFNAVKNQFLLTTNTLNTVTVHSCVIATGNNLPRNPTIKNPIFFESGRYQQDPWRKQPAPNKDLTLPVLILGNSLTMIDSVLSLLEQNPQTQICSLSPNGFAILPHRHQNMPYSLVTADLQTKTLPQLARYLRKHIDTLAEIGVLPEPIIDAVRPHVQTIWQRLSSREKRFFFTKLRHAWGIARHRAPAHLHDRLQQLRIDQQLTVYSGNLINLIEEQDGVTVYFYNKKTKQNETMRVCKVINGTGPETDLMRLDDTMLKRALLHGIIAQDELKLGIAANANTFQVVDSNGNTHQRLFTIGGTLKGVLWETTAVAELRTQAEQVAKTILKTN